MFKKQKVGITREGQSIYIHGTNDFSISSLKGSKEYRHYPFVTDSSKNMSRKLLKSYDFGTMEDGFVLKLNMNDMINGGNKLTPSSTLTGLLRKTSMCEDISRAYYDVSLYSKSIRDLNMKMEFNGSIGCQIHQDDYNPTSWKINMSSIELANCHH